MTTERNIPVLYLVIPCYNEEAVLPETTKRLTEKMHSMSMTAARIKPGRSSPNMLKLFPMWTA